jgi:hypothetical protein
MRNQLYKLEKQRCNFISEFVRYGQYKNGYYDRYNTTVLLRRLTTINNNKIVAEHIWIPLKYIPSIKDKVQTGDMITFTATVQPYIKGYRGKRIDLIFSHPIKHDYALEAITNVKILSKEKIL